MTLRSNSPLDGVTIVEGPNEVGKTSLAEALTLALEQLDSSTRSEIRDAKPVHNDAGPWVEIELSTGPVPPHYREALDSEADDASPCFRTESRGDDGAGGA